MIKQLVDKFYLWYRVLDCWRKRKKKKKKKKTHKMSAAKMRMLKAYDWQYKNNKI